MAKLIQFQSLLFISLTLNMYLIESALPYNPLYALDWDAMDLFEQISDDFKLPEAASNALQFEVRTLDGIDNNENGGESHSKAQRCMPAMYADGINEPNGKTRMEPREISNVISKQEPEDSMKFVNERFLTQFAWQWGQFIDHDVTLISEARSTQDHSLDNGDISLYVPCNDPEFDTEETCDADVFIELFRTLEFPNTGTSETNPRMQTNEITSFIDASMIYGSDEGRAAVLRSNAGDGKLDVTDDDFLPRNTRAQPNEPNTEERFVLAGDVRPNEHLGLLTMHTIWVRFHNVIADEVAESIINTGNVQKDEDEFDEIVYQYTKLIVTAVVQKITYKDWLPTMFGPDAIAKFLGDYDGFDASINPSACLIFSSAAYRLGHTLLPNFIPLRENDCSIWTAIGDCIECDQQLGGIKLRASFFVPDISEKYPDDPMNHISFMDALLNGFSCTLANEIDVSVTGAVRNFLFESAFDGENNKIFGNLDLIAINLARAREHGLPDYNSVREHVGLDKLSDFDEMTSDPDLQQDFETIYGDIDDIDLFLGLLAEDHLDDGSFGETISGVVLQQFGRLRDGDRFWYQRYIKSGELLDFIECMTLKSVIELTTGISNIDAIDSIRHNIFQNRRAISIFAGKTSPGDTFQAQAVPKQQTNIIQQQTPYQYEPNDNNSPYIIQLTNMQIFSIFALIIITIGCTCFTLYQCKKNKMNRYRPVKYDTESDTEASDREKLQN